MESDCFKHHFCIKSKEGGKRYWAMYIVQILGGLIRIFKGRNIVHNPWRSLPQACCTCISDDFPRSQCRRSSRSGKVGPGKQSVMAGHYNLYLWVRLIVGSFWIFGRSIIGLFLLLPGLDHTPHATGLDFEEMPYTITLWFICRRSKA
jgi:hypothetical protein